MKTFLSLILTTLFYSSVSHGAVNWRTGNYHAQFIEEQITLPNGEIWKWERVYDSASDHDGWWGTGWGSNLETRLDVGSDGALYLVNNGTGPISLFEASTDQLALLKKEIQDNPNLSKDQREYQLKKMSESAQSRWESLAKNKNIKMKNELNEWQGHAIGLGSIKRVGSALVWTREGIRLAEFSLDGKLQKIFRGPYSLELERKNDRPHRLSGNKNIYLDFSWSTTGARLEKTIAGKKSTAYIYENSQIQKASGTSYPEQKYEWQNNLLTSLSQGDFKENIVYDPKSNRVKKVAQNEKSKTYSWKDTATETSLVIDEVPGVTQSIVYRYRTEPSGEKFLVAQEHKKGSYQKSIEFLPCCSLPVKIIEGSNIYNLKYDDSNRLLEINFPDGSFHKYTWLEAGRIPTSIERPEGSAQVTVKNGKAIELSMNGEKIIAKYNGEQLIGLERQGKNPLNLQLEYKDGLLWRARVGDLAGIEFQALGREMKAQGPKVALGKLEFHAIYMKFLEWTRSYDPSVLMSM